MAAKELFLLLLDGAKFSVLILRKGNKPSLTLQYQTQKVKLSQDGGRAATFLCPPRGMRCCSSFVLKEVKVP